jgi:phenylacetic acid degradation operon negative regulatory protein
VKKFTLHLRYTSELLLESLLWLASAAARPTLSNLLDMPAYPCSRQQIYRMEEAGYLEKERNDRGVWVYRLTRLGTLAAHGGRDPSEEWSRKWDGHWRFFLFDIPRGAERERQRLLKWFRLNHFGCLQNSVWVTPHPLNDFAKELSFLDLPPEAMIPIEGKPLGASEETSKGIVSRAWDFDEINSRYREYRVVATERERSLRSKDWKTREREAWIRAISLDPMLPKALLPREYEGRKAWRERQKLTRKFAKAV